MNLGRPRRGQRVINAGWPSLGSTVSLSSDLYFSTSPTCLGGSPPFSTSLFRSHLSESAGTEGAEPFRSSKSPQDTPDLFFGKQGVAVWTADRYFLRYFLGVAVVEAHAATPAGANSILTCFSRHNRTASTRSSIRVIYDKVLAFGRISQPKKG